MTNRGKTISINILSVFIILVSVLFAVVGQTNSWFTAEDKNGIEIVVDVGDLRLAVYQVETAKLTNYVPNDNDKILNDEENGALAAASRKYIELESGELIPEEWMTVNLVLSNNDQGAASMYVKFKFELFKRGLNGDEKVEIIIDGYDKNTSKNGFVQNGEWLCYQNTSGQNVEFPRGNQVVLMKTFKIPYSSFVDTTTGNFKLGNSETLYAKLTIHASLNANFS